MRPPIRNQNLHLINQTPPRRLIPASTTLPPPHPPPHPPLLKPPHRSPPLDPIPPDPLNARSKRRPHVRRVHGGVGVGSVSDADVRVQPDAAGEGEGVVGVDEAAFGGFEVVGG